MSDSAVKKRLKLYLDSKGWTARDFERAAGLGNGTCAKIGSATRQTTLDRISNSNIDLNIEWLMTGEGEMLRNNTFQEDTSNQVPLIPASAFAGSISGFAAEMITLDHCEFINAPVDGAEMAIPITGDSMEPEYPNGAYAYIRKINEQAFIPWGHTVILDTENGAFIKKIYPDEKDDEYIWAKSINPNYPPLHVPKSCVLHIFRVLAVSRIFTTM